MGGKPCLNETDRLARKRAAQKKYQKKLLDLKIPKSEKKKEQCRKSSLAYYYRNQETCNYKAQLYTAANPGKHKLAQKKAYQKRRYNRNVIFIKKSKIIGNKCQKDFESGHEPES